MSILKKITLGILILIGLTIRDKDIYVALPFLIYVLWGNIKDSDKREKIIKWIGLIGAAYTVLGFSFEGFITNRGSFLIIISLIFNYTFYKKKIKLPYKPIIYGYFTIFILGIIWNILSPGGFGGIERFISVNKRFLVMIFLYNVIDTEEKFKKLINIFLIGSVITGGYTIYKYIDNLSLGYRADGFMNIPYTAGVLMMSSLMFFGKIWDEEFNWKIKSTYLYILGFIITYGGMLCTKTRAVVIGSFLGIFLIMIMKIKVKKTIGCILIGIGLLIGSPKTIKKDIFTRITQITFKANEKNENMASDNFRRIMWHGSIYAWEQSKIFGVGSRNTGNYVQKYADLAVKENGEILPGISRADFTYREAHSIYLNYLAEVGILIVGYLIILYGIIPNLIYKIWKRKNIKYCGEFLGASGAIVSYYFYGLVWSVWGYYGLIQDIFQFMTYILIMVYIYNKRKENL
ncbi:O-antigen ligase family protein [Cetobacterium ceti]